MNSITFTSNATETSYARVTDGIANSFTEAGAATVGDLQAIADAYLDGYDGDGAIEFEIIDTETGMVLAACSGKPNGTASCTFAD